MEIKVNNFKTIEKPTVCYGKKAIIKKPAQPSYNPQHKQKCETFVSTRLDNNWISGDRTTHGTTAYKQKYETVACLRLVLRLVRHNPAYNPMVFELQAQTTIGRKAGSLSCCLVFFVFLRYLSYCWGGRSSQKWSRSSVQPMVQARYNPKHNPL